MGTGVVSQCRSCQGSRFGFLFRGRIHTSALLGRRSPTRCLHLFVSWASSKKRWHCIRTQLRFVQAKVIGCRGEMFTANMVVLGYPRCSIFIQPTESQHPCIPSGWILREPEIKIFVFNQKIKNIILRKMN